MQPCQITEHEARTESDRAPVSKVLVYASGLRDEILAAAVELAVMVQIVDGHFKAVASEFLAQFLRSRVIAFRNKIERRAKTQLHLQFHELPTTIQSSLTFHIVGEYQGKLFSSRPSRPILWGLRRSLTDWPRIREPRLQSPGSHSPQRNTK